MGIVRHSQQHVEVLFAQPFSVSAREWNEAATSPIGLGQSTSHVPARRYERFANGGASTLTTPITASDQILAVTTAAGFPTEGNFRVIIDSEILLVTNVQGRTFTVERGQEGTTAASHEDGAGVFHVLTAGALAARDLDQSATGVHANLDAPGQAGRLYFPDRGFVRVDTGESWNLLPLTRMTPPRSASFTWVNQGTYCTVQDLGGMMVLRTSSMSSGDSLRLLVKTAPTPPYSLTVAMIAQAPPPPSGTQGTEGVVWRDSSSGKVVVYGWGQLDSGYKLQKTTWNSPTSLATQSVFSRRVPPTWPWWIRLVDDGVNRWAELSSDGFTWNRIEDPESRSTFITPDQVGVFANIALNTHQPRRVVSFLHWNESVYG